MYAIGEHQGSTESKKKRRCFHRVISGIERGGQLRFITLTSSPESPKDIQRSWRALYMRLKRRGLIRGYIKVPEYTKNGRIHLHVLYRGGYIDHYVIKSFWMEIHKASIVDIRMVKREFTKKRMANELAKYMSKENAGRYSWSWGWVWKGFCKDWSRLKRTYWYLQLFDPSLEFEGLLRVWRFFLHKTGPERLYEFLADWEPTKREWESVFR